MRPLTYYRPSTGFVGGHYKVAQKSGALAATIAAGGYLGSIRNSSSEIRLVIQRIRVGYAIVSAVTTAVIMDAKAVIARGFTVDFTTAITQANMAAVGKTNSMRTAMSQSRLGTKGPCISTTTVQSGQTLTEDANAFATVVFPNPSSTLGASAVTNQVGAATQMATLYEWTGLGDHPIVLEQNEGVLIEPMTAGPASGTYNIYVEWTWAEVDAF